MNINIKTLLHAFEKQEIPAHAAVGDGTTTFSLTPHCLPPHLGDSGLPTPTKLRFPQTRILGHFNDSKAISIY